MKQKYSSLGQKLQVIATSMTQVKNFSTKLDLSVKRAEALQSLIRDLQCNVDDFENRSRRNNLVTYGVEEATHETEQLLTDTSVDGIFKA